MKQSLLRVAQGLFPADLVLKNAQVINVFSGEILPADVAICEDTIVGVGRYHGKREIDLTGKYLCPGFIDAHLHVESSMVRPSEFFRRAAFSGTTTFLVDPHEVANVSGSEGIRYLIAEAEQSPANVYIMLPSCVPAAPFEKNGGSFSAEEMRKMLADPHILGLGEVMDFPAVLSGEPTMMEKLDLFRERPIDGHAGFFDDSQLAAYCLAGISSDHECASFESALQERRSGLQILIREGSAAKNLDAIISGLIRHPLPLDGFCFCTDDKHIDDIEQDGHISYSVRRSIELGISPVDAIRMATIHPAKAYGLHRIGAIAPGYQADFIILNDLRRISIESVYHKGVPVVTLPSPNFSCPEKLLHTVHMQSVSAEQLSVPAGDVQPVIELIPEQINTHKKMYRLPEKDGFFLPNAEFSKLAVVERHHASGLVSAAAVRGFGIHGGAIATSVSHDSHNIVVIGDNDFDMLRCVEKIGQMQGGCVLVREHVVQEALPLPIMGLMSGRSYHEVKDSLERFLRLAREMGVPQGIDPLVTLSFLALPVLGELRLTPLGLFDVPAQKFLRQNPIGGPQ